MDVGRVTSSSSCLRGDIASQFEEPQYESDSPAEMDAGKNDEIPEPGAKTLAGRVHGCTDHEQGVDGGYDERRGEPGDPGSQADHADDQGGEDADDGHGRHEVAQPRTEASSELTAPDSGGDELADELGEARARPVDH